MSPEAVAEVAEAMSAVVAEAAVAAVEVAAEAHKDRAYPTHVAQRPARYQDRCVRRGLRSQSLLL